MISLQADVHEETGVWVPVDNIWAQLRKMYDLEALDGMVSGS
jgi:predicted Rossmann-fold nucleotide-binding protein